MKINKKVLHVRKVTFAPRLRLRGGQIKCNQRAAGCFSQPLRRRGICSRRRLPENPWKGSSGGSAPPITNHLDYGRSSASLGGSRHCFFFFFLPVVVTQNGLLPKCPFASFEINTRQRRHRSISLQTRSPGRKTCV